MIAALFPYARKIGRGEYAIRLLVCLLLSVPVLLWRWQVVQHHRQGESLLFLLALIVLLVIFQTQAIARLRDADASPLFSGLVFIPYLNAAFALALLFPPSHGAQSVPRDAVPGPTA